jgi:hypothetical protein
VAGRANVGQFQVADLRFLIAGVSVAAWFFLREGRGLPNRSRGKLPLGTWAFGPRNEAK